LLRIQLDADKLQCKQNLFETHYAQVFPKSNMTNSLADSMDIKT